VGDIHLPTWLVATGILLLIAAICFRDAHRWNQCPQTIYRFFLLSGRLNLGPFVSTIIAANLSLGNFIIFVSIWGYKYGAVGLILFCINVAFNFVGFFLFLPAFRAYIESHLNNGTIHDFVAKAYDDDELGRGSAAIRFTASLATVIGLIFAITFELSLAVSLLEPENQFKGFIIFSLLTILITGFTAYGGYRTLYMTDLFQSGVIISVTFILLAIRVTLGSPVGNMAAIRNTEFEPMPWTSAVSILFVGSGWMLVAMDQWQRTCATRSSKTAFLGTAIYCVPMILFAIVYGLWGMYDKAVILPNLSTDLPLQVPEGRNPLLDLSALSDLGIPDLLISLMITGLIAAAVSTTNTFLTVSSHSLTSDVLLTSFAARSIHNLNKQENQGFVRIGGILVVAGGAIIVLLFGGLQGQSLLYDPLKFFYIAYSFQFALLAPVVMTRVSRFYRPSSAAALAGIIVGIIAAAGFGVGSWAFGRYDPTFAKSDWLALTPIVTFGAGLMPLLYSYLKKRCFGTVMQEGR